MSLSLFMSLSLSLSISLSFCWSGYVSSSLRLNVSRFTSFWECSLVVFVTMVTHLLTYSVTRSPIELSWGQLKSDPVTDQCSVELIALLKNKNFRIQIDVLPYIRVADVEVPKGRTPNIRYFVAKLGIVAIYALYEWPPKAA